MTGNKLAPSSWQEPRSAGPILVASDIGQGAAEPAVGGRGVREGPSGYCFAQSEWVSKTDWRQSSSLVVCNSRSVRRASSPKSLSLMVWLQRS